ncbi:TadE family type IV pilus minor pilin [Microbacterium sp.]|uniref:TadE family type IV pilus minor pilin n=1 Tax=Microbacterium sp. TaxID=51671 RepID=UPI002E37DB60|nr:TadE family type IV pilus minor pilin [Microbacterium sp.]HEX5729964.1 TadE family type IV pilus minor pilin [Microbacterium sp.]
MIRRGLGDDRGSVVAEFAVALPAVAVVVLLGAGALGACATQVRLQDAAADAARLAARGEADGRAQSVVASAVSGASLVLTRRGDLVCVTASASAAVSLPLTLSATSCALDGGL